MSETHEPHLTDDVLAAYLDRSLPPTEAHAAETHLAGCLPCRDELVALSALVHREPAARRWRRFAVPAGALAAAAVAFMMFAPWRTTPAPGTLPPDRMRESTRVGSGIGLVSVVVPAEDDTVAATNVTFVWRPFGPNGTYLLRLADESAVRWTIDTGDTTVVLPDSVRLDRGRSYQWWVDAITSDGRSVSTGIRRFRTTP
ncbi:MAG TPA: zf-HC2 domain-containing protein [Gemmatimonadaceae bacterium]|nr:zf-HC2 domain-containing protein [Gemmatimonadaceae bacterium]